MKHAQLWNPASFTKAVLQHISGCFPLGSTALGPSLSWAQVPREGVLSCLGIPIFPISLWNCAWQSTAVFSGPTKQSRTGGSSLGRCIPGVPSTSRPHLGSGQRERGGSAAPGTPSARHEQMLSLLPLAWRLLSNLGVMDETLQDDFRACHGKETPILPANGNRSRVCSPPAPSAARGWCPSLSPSSTRSQGSAAPAAPEGAALSLPSSTASWKSPDLVSQY